jgi:hypothetical protein
MSHLFRISLAAVATAAAGALVLSAPAAEAQAAGKFRMNLAYEGRLLVKVLDVAITQEADDSGYASTARLTSYGVLAAFKKINQVASARGAIDRGMARPAVFNHHNRASKRGRKIEVRFTPASVTATATPRYKSLGEPPASPAQRLESVDPITGLMRLALSDSQGQLCTGTWKFFDGKQRYDLVFSNRAASTATPREKRLGLINTVRCNVVYREVAGFKKKPPAERNQGLNKPIKIVLGQAGASGPWVISSLTGSTPLGNAVIELSSLTRSGVAPQD